MQTQINLQERQTKDYAALEPPAGSLLVYLKSKRASSSLNQTITGEITKTWYLIGVGIGVQPNLPKNQ